MRRLLQLRAIRAQRDHRKTTLYSSADLTVDFFPDHKTLEDRKESRVPDCQSCDSLPVRKSRRISPNRFRHARNRKLGWSSRIKDLPTVITGITGVFATEPGNGSWRPDATWSQKRRRFVMIRDALLATGNSRESFTFVFPAILRLLCRAIQASWHPLRISLLVTLLRRCRTLRCQHHHQFMKPLRLLSALPLESLRPSCSTCPRNGTVLPL